jgi:hypothetical protein
MLFKSTGIFFFLACVYVLYRILPIYAWRKRFGELEAVDVKRLRQLEAENARLKKVWPSA